MILRNRITRLALLLLLPASMPAAAQKTDQRLADELQAAIQDFHGDIGLYVYDLKKDREVAIRADTVFPTASIVKIPILIGLLRKLSTGELQYHQRLTYTDSQYFKEGDDILSNFKPGSTIELGKVMLLMLSISDNCASVWLQGIAGAGATINRILDTLGFPATRVNSRTPGREWYREKYGWGQTTPRSIARIMMAAVKGRIFDRATSDRMLRLMSRQWWDEEAISSIPAGIFIADKNGALDSSRNEIMYVNGRHPYILSIFTRNNQDTSWESNNEAWVLTRKISSLVWKHFNGR